jgi:hypothetical protein
MIRYIRSVYVRQPAGKEEEEEEEEEAEEAAAAATASCTLL